MTQIRFQTRRAHPGDAEAILAAHLDSIRSIGPRFYPPEIVEAWTAGLTSEVYVRGSAARRGIANALLRLAEEHARAHGATSLQIQASLAGCRSMPRMDSRSSGEGKPSS